jgi:hypothetical protein
LKVQDGSGLSQRGTAVKKMLLALAAVAGFAVVLLSRDEDAKVVPGAAPAVKAAGALPESGLGIVYEERGRFESLRGASTLEAVPLLEQQIAKMGMGETKSLAFSVRERASGAVRPGAHLKARAYHGQDKPIELPVNEVGKGKYEVPFTPEAPGQFNVVLSEDDRPVGSQRVGVVGVVGADPSLSDPNALDEADPMEFRARTPGRLLTR